MQSLFEIFIRQSSFCVGVWAYFSALYFCFPFEKSLIVTTVTKHIDNRLFFLCSLEGLNVFVSDGILFVLLMFCH